MTKYSIDEVSSVERCINVELSAEEVKAAISKAFDDINANVTIPGFRKGKAPRRRLEAAYKGRAISDALDHLLQSSYAEVMEKEKGLNPISYPHIVPGEFKENEGFSYKATVEVRPEIKLADIAGIPLHRHDLTVTDEMVEKSVEQIRVNHADDIPVEGRDVAEKGDIATVDFTGSIDGKPFAGGVEENAPLELVEGDFMRDGKSEVMVGAKIGETRSLDYTFTEDLVGKGHALVGKVATVQLTLKALSTRKLPELNDDFAKKVGLGDTMDAMRAKIREDISDRMKHQAEHHTRDQLLKGLRDRNPIEVPKSMVENLARRNFEDIKHRMAQQGVPVNDQMTLDNSPMAAQLRAAATDEVKNALLLDAVASQEKIEATDADIEERVKKMAEDSKLGIDLVRNYLNSPSTRPNVMAQIREEKTMALLESKAAITEAPEHEA